MEKISAAFLSALNRNIASCYLVDVFEGIDVAAYLILATYLNLLPVSSHFTPSDNPNFMRQHISYACFLSEDPI